MSPTWSKNRKIWKLLWIKNSLIQIFKPQYLTRVSLLLCSCHSTKLKAPMYQTRLLLLLRKQVSNLLNKTKSKQRHRCISFRNLMFKEESVYWKATLRFSTRKNVLTDVSDNPSKTYNQCTVMAVAVKVYSYAWGTWNSQISRIKFWRSLTQKTQS